MKKLFIATLTLMSFSAFAQNIVLENGNITQITCNKSVIKVCNTKKDSVVVSCVRACVITLKSEVRYGYTNYCSSIVRPGGTNSDNCGNTRTREQAIELAYEQADFVLSRNQCDEVIYVNLEPRA